MTAWPAKHVLGRVMRGAGVAAGAAAGLGASAVLWSRFLVDHDVPLPDAIDAPRRTLDPPGVGRLSYYADTTAPGRPLVLVHSINAAASAYEMRPLFERFRRLLPVYALDLPGFGFSERSERSYTPALYRDALIALLEEVGEADVVALSLSAEHAALAAAARPDLFHTLTLISPTGFSSPDRRPAVERRDPDRTPRRTLLGVGALDQALFDLLATRVSARHFLRKSFVGEVDEGLLDYALATAHQPGARWAPFAFLRGELFVPGILDVYAQVRARVLVVHDEDEYTGFAMLGAFFEEHPRWRVERIPHTRGLPQFDAPDETASAIRNHLGAPLQPTPVA